jgi:glutaredoxin 3
LREHGDAVRLTVMARVIVYTTQMCPYCVQAKRLLGERSIPYDEIDVGSDDGVRNEMVQKAGGKRTVPQIFIDGAYVGGYTELRALADKGGLTGLS